MTREHLLIRPLHRLPRLRRRLPSEVSSARCPSDLSPVKNEGGDEVPHHCTHRSPMIPEQVSIFVGRSVACVPGDSGAALAAWWLATPVRNRSGWSICSPRVDRNPSHAGRLWVDCAASTGHRSRNRQLPGSPASRGRYRVRTRPRSGNSWEAAVHDHRRRRDVPTHRRGFADYFARLVSRRHLRRPGKLAGIRRLSSLPRCVATSGPIWPRA